MTMFTPRYTEVQLVLIATVILLLLCTDPYILKYVLGLTHEAPVAGVLLAIAVLYSIYHAFSSKRKSAIAKTFLFLLAIGTTTWAAIAAGFYTLAQYGQSKFMIIFPAINIVSAFMLLIRAGLGKITEDVIANDNASLREILVAIFGTVVLFTFAQKYYQMYWALLLSICLTYGTALDLVFARRNRDNSRVSD